VCVCGLGEQGTGLEETTLSWTSRRQASHRKPMPHAECAVLCVCCVCVCAVQDFAKAGAGGGGMMFTYHLEACADPASLSKDSAHPAVVDLAQKVRQAGMKVRHRTQGTDSSSSSS
jgi:hypothetical protein